MRPQHRVPLRRNDSDAIRVLDRSQVAPVDDPYSGPYARMLGGGRTALRNRLTEGVAIGAISTALRRSWLEANYRRMVRLTFALLPSPLLGPEAWGPVAEVLRSGGWSVLEQAGAAEPPGAPGDVLKRFLAALPPDRDLVLVPHSNAGLYVPELTRKRRVIGYVFVDAILPPDGGTVPVALQHLVTELESLADKSGILPPWTAWWGEDDLRGVYPDPDTRGRIEEQAPRIPVRYQRSTINLPLNWNSYPGAYLAFGDTYAEHRATALALGWPTATITGRHLHQLHQPDVVAEQILALARQAGLESLSPYR
jgi:hypothetical protein